MKAQNKLNVVLTVLVIILISIISFAGVYRLDKNQMVSVLPNYILGTDISGYRKITLEVINENDGEQSSSETVELGATENATQEENQIAENNIQEETTNEIDNETLKEENAEKYRKSADIFRARLKSLKVEDYTVSCDENSGKIEITIPENDQTDTIISDIVQTGEFSISDTNTGEILLTNKDVKSVNVGVTESYGYYLAGMNINFKTSASKKLKNISIDYNSNAVIETNTVSNDVVQNDTVENEVAETNTVNNGNEIDNEDSDESTEVAKTIDLKIDNVTMLSTGFSETIENGTLSLTIGSSTDEEEIKETVYGGYNVAAIIENDPLPVEYDVTGNIYVQSTIQVSDVNIIVYVIIGIAVILSVLMIIKFKMKGLLFSILSVGYVAILLLVIRCANVVLSIEGIFAIGLSYILNLVFNYILLLSINNKELSKKERIEKYDNTLKKYGLTLIPVVLLSIICCFINWDTIYSFGMVMFWGIVISLLYNLTITNLLIRNK